LVRRERRRGWVARLAHTQRYTHAPTRTLSHSRHTLTQTFSLSLTHSPTHSHILSHATHLHTHSLSRHTCEQHFDPRMSPLSPTRLHVSHVGGLARGDWRRVQHVVAEVNTHVHVSKPFIAQTASVGSPGLQDVCMETCYMYRKRQLQT
jgi:hypothetical protein